MDKLSQPEIWYDGVGEYSQPSYCITIQYHPLWFWMMDKLSQPEVWYDGVAWVNTVNPSTVWPFNIIHCGFLMMENLCQPEIVIIIKIWYDGVGECIYTVYSQPSYCLTIQYHPLWFCRETTSTQEHTYNSLVLSGHKETLYLFRIFIFFYIFYINHKGNWLGKLWRIW